MSQGIDPASFLTGANAPFIAELYSRWRLAPDSVDPSWAKFFSEINDEAIVAELEGPGWGTKRPRVIGNGAANGNGRAAVAGTGAAAAAAGVKDVQQAVIDSIRALTLIRSYRVKQR